MTQELIKRSDGRQEWTELPGDKCIVTGVTVDGKRFKLYFINWYSAKAINLWRGSKWIYRNGKRILLQRVTN